MLSSLRKALPRAALTAALAAVLWAPPVLAQMAGASGPGQTVPIPPAQCAPTIACQYGERNYLPDGYRFQMLQLCGADCTTQYWVSNISDNQVLLTIEPVRGGGIIAVGQGASPEDQHPPVRTVVPSYASTDPACCPSQYQDTTYSWDPGSNALVAGDVAIIPATEFPGWDNVRQSLQDEQFSPVFPAS